MKDGSACVMAHGTAERVRVAGVDALGALIEDLTPSQALALGALRADLPDKVAVTTKKMLVNGAARPDIIARTGANIVYHGPAFALLDYRQQGDAGHRRGRAAAARRLLAGAADGAAGTGGRGAADAELDQRRTVARRYRGCDAGSDGVHVYVAVKDGADSERFLRALHDRCWLAGFGWMMVSPSGALLEPLASSTGWSVGPERLVFEGGPVLMPPLQQDKASRRPISR